MATYVVTIGGATKVFRYQALTINATANGVDTLDGDLISEDGSYVPALDDEIIVTEDGTRIFGGNITSLTKAGLGGVGLTAIVNRISATDFNGIAQRRYANETLAAGTLKSMLTTLVANYLDDYGVTLHASQANGATLAAATFEYRRVDEVLNDLAAATGWVWEIDYSKVLRMKAPGADAAPFDVIENDGNAIGDIEIEYSKVQTANRVRVIVGSDSVVAKEETFTATSGQTSFPLTYPLNDGSIDPYRNIIGTITRNVVNFETVGSSGATWTYDYATNAVVRSSGVTLGQSVLVRYKAKFPITVSAEDAADIATHGLTEAIVTRTDLFDADQAQAIADGLLVTRTPSAQRVTYQTDSTGLAVGMSQHITAASRHLDEDCIVTDIRASHVAGQIVRRKVTAEVGTQFTGSWRDTYKAWSGGGSSSGTPAALSVTAPAENLIGWSTDEPTRTLYPDDDGVRYIGDDTHRVAGMVVKDGTSGSQGYRGYGADSSARIGFVNDPSTPAWFFSFLNSFASAKTPLRVYQRALDAVFLDGSTGEGLRMQDASLGFELLVVMLSTLTANRTLSITTGDANRAITLSGNPTLADWFDQAVKSTSSPAFAALTVVPGSASLTARAGGVIYQSITAVGNVGAGEDDLISQSIAANVLSANGQRIVGEFNGRFAANGNAKRIRLKFGATTILDMGTGISPNGNVWRLQYTITRTGAATQRVSASLLIGGISGPVFTGVTTAAETLSGAITLKATGEATSNDDIVNDEFWCEWKPA